MSRNWQNFNIRTIIIIHYTKNRLYKERNKENFQALEYKLFNNDDNNPFNTFHCFIFDIEQKAKLIKQQK